MGPKKLSRAYFKVRKRFAAGGLHPNQPGGDVTEHVTVCASCVKDGPEPLEIEINKILGSKREVQFSDHFSGLVQNICSVRFS